MSIVLEEPRFNKKQFNSATSAAKSFGSLRKKAKLEPQLILENNSADSVLLDYKMYEEMYLEIQKLKEQLWEMKIAQRIEKADSTGVRFSLEEVMGEEYQQYRNIDPDSISDEDLFE